MQANKHINIQEVIDLISRSYEDLEEFIKSSILILARLTDSDIAGIYLPDPFEQKGLELKFVVEKENESFKLLEKEGYYLPYDKGIVGWVYRNKVTYISDNTEEDKFYIPLEDVKKSDVAVPIISKRGNVVSVINFEKENSFSKEDIENINLVVPIISSIINYHFDIQEKEYESKFFKSLYTIYRIFQSYDDLDTIFNKLMNYLADSINIDRGMIFLTNENTNELRIIKGFGLGEEEINRGVYKIGEGIVGLVAQTKKSISIPNIWEDKKFLNKTKAKRQRNKKISFFANPIVSENDGKVLGVITLEKEFENLTDFNTTQSIIKELSEMIAISVLRYIKLKKEKEELLDENRLLKEQLLSKYGFENIVGKSEKMLKILDLVSTISRTNSTVLIEGESGTGKELIAKTIHYLSPRSNKPFTAINCAAIPETLLESELFGYKKGSFTGANTDKKGKILLADGGTLFLDEIGDMPVHLQAKLLRVLQEREVEPIGGTPVKVDIRVIAATNKNLEKLIEEGKFRLDLYYRLNVVKLEIPPLRERIDDIPLLVEFFVKKFSKEHNKQITEIHKEFIDLMMLYNWPGNIRELENVIEQAVILSKDGRITKDLLPPKIRGVYRLKESLEDEIREIIASYVSSANIEKETNLYDKVISPITKTLINQVLIKTNDNKIKASEILGINRNTLSSYIKKYNL